MTVAVLGRRGSESPPVSLEHDVLTAVVPVTVTALAAPAATHWWSARKARRDGVVREAAIDRTAARVERADQLDRLEKEVARKDERITQLEREMQQMRADFNALAVEVARYRAGLVAPASYVLVPRGVIEAIRATHPGALPAVYPGEETPPT